MNAIRIATRPDIVRRSLLVSAVVGTILNLINQHEALSDIRSVNLFKLLLTYMVPYCVATYGAVSALMSLDSNGWGVFGAY